MVAFALATALALVLAIRGSIFTRLSELQARLEKGADAAGVPPERVVKIGGDDVFVRLESLCERLLASHRPPDAAAPPRGPPTDRTP